MKNCLICLCVPADSSMLEIDFVDQRFDSALWQCAEFAAKYRFKKLLTNNSSGATVLASNSLLNRLCLITVLPAKLLADAPELRATLYGELNCAASVVHPNLSGVLDFGDTADNGFFIVSEHHKHQTLFDFLRDQHLLSAELTINLVRQAAHGLAAAERGGIAPRTINPNNLIVLKNVGNKLILKVRNLDFGGVRGRLATAVQDCRFCRQTNAVSSLAAILAEVCEQFLSPKNLLMMENQTEIQELLRRVRVDPPISLNEFAASLRNIERSLALLPILAARETGKITETVVATEQETTIDFPYSLNPAHARPQALSDVLTIQKPRSQVSKNSSIKFFSQSLATVKNAVTVFAAAMLLTLAVSSLLNFRAVQTVAQNESSLNSHLANASPLITEIARPQKVSAAKLPKINAAPRPNKKEIVRDSKDKLNDSLNHWIAATNERDFDAQMNHYAPTVNAFYLSKNASRADVSREKHRVFGRARQVRMATDQPEIVVSADGQTAKMRFRKQYLIKTNLKNRSGAVVQELGWQKSGEDWKIISERDLRVLYD